MQHKPYRPHTSVKPRVLMLAILSCLAIQARAHATDNGHDAAAPDDAKPAPAAPTPLIHVRRFHSEPTHPSRLSITYS